MRSERRGHSARGFFALARALRSHDARLGGCALILAFITLLGIGAGPFAPTADAAPATSADSMTSASATTAQPNRVSAGDVQLNIDQAPTALDADSPLSITATVTNNGSEPLTSVMVDFYLGNRLMNTTSQVRDWFDSTGADGPANRSTKIGGRTADAIAPGDSATVTLETAAERLPTWQFSDGKGVLGFAARLTSTSSDSVWQQSTLAWNVSQSDLKPLNVIAPVTGPSDADRYYSADRLQQLTDADGDLTAQLDALSGLNVQLAVDPKIVSSITALGASAPADAVAWRDRLEAFPDVTPLLWGDADVNALAAAGVRHIDDALLGDGAAGDADSPLVLAQSSEDLTPAALDLISGSRPVILGTDMLQDASADVSLRQMQGTSLIGANHNLIDAFQSALNGETSQQRQNRDRITAMATALGLSTEDFSAVTAVLPRGWGEQAKQAGDALHAIDDSVVRLRAGVQITGDTTDVQQTELANANASSEDDLSPLEQIADSAASVERLASISADPDSVRDAFVQQTASLCGAGWERDDAWSEAVSTRASENDAQLQAVAITSTTNLTLVSGSSQIPVAVRNDTAQPVTVQVHIFPSSGRVTTASPVPLTIDPNSAATAQVPVRAIANGSVVLNIGITNGVGDPIGQTVSRPMDVQAQWEGIGLAVIGAAVTLLFGFGLVRSLIRNRRQRRGQLALEAPAEVTTDGIRPTAPRGSDTPTFDIPTPDDNPTETSSR